MNGSQFKINNYKYIIQTRIVFKNTKNYLITWIMSIKRSNMNRREWTIYVGISSSYKNQREQLDRVKKKKKKKEK